MAIAAVYRGRGKDNTIGRGTKRFVFEAVIRGRVDTGGIIHSDGWRGYSGFVDFGEKKHYRVNHGVADTTLYLHLKECESDIIIDTVTRTGCCLKCSGKTPALVKTPKYMFL